MRGQSTALLWQCLSFFYAFLLYSKRPLKLFINIICGIIFLNNDENCNLLGTIPGLKLYPVILADDDTRAAAQAGAPLLGRRDFLQPVQLTYTLQTLIDQLPGAGAVRPDFAAVFPRATAWAVQ